MTQDQYDTLFGMMQVMGQNIVLLGQSVAELKVDVAELNKRMQNAEKNITLLQKDNRAIRKEIATVRQEMSQGFAQQDEVHMVIMQAIESPFLELSKDFKKTKRNHDRRISFLEKQFT